MCIIPCSPEGCRVHLTQAQSIFNHKIARLKVQQSCFQKMRLLLVTPWILCPIVKLMILLRIHEYNIYFPFPFHFAHSKCCSVSGVLLVLRNNPYLNIQSLVIYRFLSLLLNKCDIKLRRHLWLIFKVLRLSCPEMFCSN